MSDHSDTQKTPPIFKRRSSGENSQVPLFPSLELNVNASSGSHIDVIAKDAVEMSKHFNMNINLILDRCEIFVVPNMTTEQEIIDEFKSFTK